MSSLTPLERGALIVLMAEGRPLWDRDLKGVHGIALAPRHRMRLQSLGNYACDRKAQSGDSSQLRLAHRLLPRLQTTDEIGIVLATDKPQAARESARFGHCPSRSNADDGPQSTNVARMRDETRGRCQGQS